MVYYSSPARILFTGEVEPIGDGDSFSSRTSPTRSKTTMGDDEDHDSEVNWSGSFQAFSYPSQKREPKRVEQLDAPKVRIPITPLSPLVDPRFREDSSHLDFQQDGNGEGTACHKDCMSSLARLAPTGRVNTRARIERMQHQLGKPIRAVSAGKRIVAQSCAFEFFKDKDDSDVRGRGQAKENGCSTQKSTSFPSREKSTGKEFPIDLGNRWAEDGWEDFEGSGVKEFRWLHSCTLWPSTKTSSVDPPGHYYKTDQAVQLYFYNDFSVEMSGEKELTAPETTSVFSSHPTAELSDEESAFILQKDDLD